MRLSQDNPYQMFYLKDEEGTPLGCIGIRGQSENHEWNCDIGFVMAARTSPKGTGKKLLQLVECEIPSETYKIVVGIKKDNKIMRKTLLSCGYQEVKEGRFEKDYI